MSSLVSASRFLKRLTDVTDCCCGFGIYSFLLPTCQEILEKAGRLVRIDEVTSREYANSMQNLTPSTARRKLVKSGSSCASHAHEGYEGESTLAQARPVLAASSLESQLLPDACLCLRFLQKQAASTASPSGPLWPLGREVRHSCTSYSTSGLNRHTQLVALGLGLRRRA